MKRIVLNVDRLVLNGFRHGDRDALAQSLRGELSRSFGQPESTRELSSRGDVARVTVPPIRIAPGTQPARVGEQVARGIARGIKS